MKMEMNLISTLYSENVSICFNFPNFGPQPKMDNIVFFFKAEQLILS